METSDKEIDPLDTPSASEPTEMMERIDALNKQGYELRKINTKMALELVRQAYRLAKDHSYERGRAHSLIVSSSCHYLTGESRVGLADALEAQEVFEVLRDKRGLGMASNYLGIHYKELGEVQNAVEAYSKALDICLEVGDRFEEAKILNNIGMAYYHLGDHVKALEYFYRSLSLKEEMNDAELLLRTLSNLGVVHEELGEHEKAIELYKQALLAGEEINDTQAISICLANLGLVYKQMGDTASSYSHLRQALESTQKYGHKAIEATILNYLGTFHKDTGEHERALASYRDALAIIDATGHRILRCQALLGLGEVLHERGSNEQAAEHILRALRIAEETANVEYIVKAHWLLSLVHESQMDFARALGHYKLFYEYRQRVFGEEAEQNLRRVMAQAEVERLQREAEIYRLRHVELAARVRDLEEALARVRHLQGLLRRDAHVYEFGPFRLEAGERRLSARGRAVALTAKVFDLLLLLVQNAGHLLEKEEIMRELWPDAEVGEDNITVGVSVLRRALGEGGERGYIETVPKRGYRFTAEVRRSA